MIQEREKILQASHLLRETLAGCRPTSPKGVEIVMENVVRPCQQTILEFSKEKGSVRKGLVWFRDAIKREKGILISPPSLCASFVMDVIGYGILINAALKAYRLGEQRMFVVYYDMANGVALAMSKILAAEREIGGTFDQFLTQGVSRPMVGDYLPDIGTQTNFYLAWRKETGEDASTLTKNPTGILVLNNFLEKVEKDPVGEFPSYLIPQFVIAGVETSIEAYKFFYPLPANLPPSKGRELNSGPAQ